MVRKILYSAVIVSLAFAFMTASVCFANTTGVVTASSLNLRAEPGTYAEIVDLLYRGTEVTVNDSSDGWYNVTYSDQTGWVKGDYLEVSESESAAVSKTESSVTGSVTGSNVNVRSGPSTSDGVLTRLNWGSNVTIISRSGEWYNVQLADGTIGWMYSNYVSTDVGSRSVGNTAGDLLAYANKFLGVGYVYGGSTQYGFDCSGFTKFVFNNFGITLNRIAADQANQGVWIDKSRLTAGDLVFFATSGGTYINHAGIYIGDGNFIHASSGAGKVIISNLWSGYYTNTYITARRMIR